jgi:hypothetical protein
MSDEYIHADAIRDVTPSALRSIICSVQWWRPSTKPSGRSRSGGIAPLIIAELHADPA